MVTYQHPFPESTVTSEWGATAGRPNAHRGRDYAPGGPPIQPWCDGVVVRSEWQSGLGWVVTVEDADGVWSSACHLAAKGAPVGTDVRRGIGAVGIVGNTGSLSKGRHLHFVISTTSSDPSSGSTLNPKPFIDARLGEPSTSGGGSTTTPNQEGFLMALSDKQQQDLYDAIMGKDPRFTNVDVIISNVQPVRDALLDPAEGGGWKLTDVLASHAGKTLASIRALARQLGKNVDDA